MEGKPFLIGIAGGSCSGKTSIARHVAGILPGRALVLGLDSYYRDFSGVPENDIEVDVPGALDGPLLVRQLEALAAGEDVVKPVYDYKTHSRASSGERVEPGEYVILEGLFVLHWTGVRELLDLGVFVTVDGDTALARRIERDVRERQRTEASVRARYRDKVLPNFEKFVLPTREFADIVLDGLEPVDVSARRILGQIPKQR